MSASNWLIVGVLSSATPDVPGTDSDGRLLDRPPVFIAADNWAVKLASSSLILAESRRIWINVWTDELRRRSFRLTSTSSNGVHEWERFVCALAVFGELGSRWFDDGEDCSTN